MIGPPPTHKFNRRDVLKPSPDKTSSRESDTLNLRTLHFFFLRTRLSHTCNHILNVYLCFSLFFEEYVRKLVVDAH